MGWIDALASPARKGAHFTVGTDGDGVIPGLLCAVRSETGCKVFRTFSRLVYKDAE